MLSLIKSEVLSRIAPRAIDVQLEAPTCSITFDDVPMSVFTNAVPILRRHDVIATFYVSAGLHPADGFIGAREIRALASQGFDIACHTFSHYSLYSGSVDAMARDAERNRIAFQEELGLRRPRDFAYPFGEVTVAAKARLGRDYATLRSVYPGVNGKGTDALLLRANPLFSGSVDWARIADMLDETARKKAWLMFYTHGVEANADEWSCVPEDLERLITECRMAGLRFRSVRSVSEDVVAQSFPADSSVLKHIAPQ